MKKLFLSCLLFIVAASVYADPPKVVPVPKPVPTKIENLDGAVVNKMFVMAAEPASRWRVDNPNDSVDLRTFDNGKTGVLVCNFPGTITITVTGPGGDLAEYRVTVVDDGGPKPPTPPVPPVDELKASLKKAFDLEAGDAATKKEFAKDLAELYRQAATLAGKAEVKTSSDLLKRCQDASVALIGNDKMLGVRRLVATQLAAILPTDAALSDPQRKATADLFKKLAVILDSFGG